MLRTLPWGRFSFIPAPSRGSEPLGRTLYLRQLQGNGLQLNITFNPRAVPRPQRLLGAVPFQEGRCTHGLQDVVVTTTLHASGHGLLGHKNMGFTQTNLPHGHQRYLIRSMPPGAGETNHFSPSTSLKNLQFLYKKTKLGFFSVLPKQ